MLLQHYFRRYCIETLYLGNRPICYLLFSKNPIKMVFVFCFVLEKNSQNPIFLYFCTATEFSDRFCEGVCHYNVTDTKLCMLVPMFRGHSKLSIKLMHGFILKIRGGGNHPSWFSVCTKVPWLDRRG